MSKHTPGEWQIGFGVTRLEIHEASGKMIATVPRDDKYGRPFLETAANAMLISAAPDLLTILKELEESASYWSEYDVPLGVVERIRSVIKKAGGAIPSADLDAYDYTDRTAVSTDCASVPK